MFLLAFQVVFAIIAFNRGWRWLPVQLLIGLTLFGALTGAIFGISQGFVIIMSTLDWALAIGLGFMAFIRKENV